MKVYAWGNEEQAVQNVPGEYKSQSTNWLEDNSSDIWWSVMEDCREYVRDYMEGDIGIDEDEISLVTDYGFYGRSGGHFCFNMKWNESELEDVIADLEALLDGNEPPYGYTYYEMLATIKDCEQVLEYAETIKQRIEDMKPDNEYITEELRYRVNEYMEENVYKQSFCTQCHHAVI